MRSAGPVWRISRSGADRDRRACRPAGARSTGLCARPSSTAATATAQAPEPQARRLADAALPHAHLDRAVGQRPPHLDVGALRKPLVVLEQRALVGRAGRRRGRRPGSSTCGLPTDTNRCGYGNGSPVGRYWSSSVRRASAMRAVTVPSAWTTVSSTPAGVAIRTSSSAVALGHEARHHARAVAAGLGLGAVGVDDPHRDVRAGDGRQHQHAVGLVVAARRRHVAPARCLDQEVDVARSLPALAPASAQQVAGQHVLAVLERGDRDALVALVRLRRVAGAVVEGRDARRLQRRDVGPGLLRDAPRRRSPR